MTKYKIGQLSKTMGVSTHLLKHYEKFDLVSPNVDQDTNYRYYDLKQCAKIIESKKYRNMGFSIKETASIVKEYDGEQLNHALSERLEELEVQIEELKRQKLLVEYYAEELAEYEVLLNQWFIEMIPEYYYLPQSKNSELIEEHDCMINQSNMMDYLPVTKSMLYIKKDTASSNKIQYSWGLAMEQLEIRKIGLDLDERYRIMPEARAFVTYLKLKVPYLETGDIIKQVVEQYYLYKYEEPKEFYGVLLKTIHEDGEEMQYIKVIVPIQ